MILFIDTESTGIFKFKLPASDPSQPRIVQLGAVLHDDQRHVVAEMNMLVKPEGWTIPKEASDIHGITTEQCLKYGFKIVTVIKLLMYMCGKAEQIVGHSCDFDRNMVDSERIRLGLLEDEKVFMAKPHFCTMKASTDICQIPGPYGNKWPKLQETYKYFFNKEFEGAHDAMADIRACAEVYYPIKEFIQANGA